MHFMLRFDHQLDAAKLRGALERLLSRQDGWRRLGGRLRRNAAGKLDYHVPPGYTEPRPALSYHHESHPNVRILQHPLGARVPGAAAGRRLQTPRILARGEDFVPLMRRPEDPTCLADYLRADDAPVLGLHVVSFADATLVTLRGSHVLFDAMGRRAFLEAWSLTLQGRDEEVAPLLERDPMATLGAPTPEKTEPCTLPVEEYKHAQAQLGPRQFLMFGLRQIVDRISQWRRRPVEEARIVCVPKPYVERLRKAALREWLETQDSRSVVAQVGDEATPSKRSAFLSDGDVLCAWWTRHLLAARLPSTVRQTICVMNMMGLRDLLLQSGLVTGAERKSAMLGNALVPVPAFFLSQELSEKPLGQMAGKLRQALQELGTWPQVEALLKLQRAALDKKGGLPALFGDGGMHMVVCTNWLKARFFDVDFSAALIPTAGKDNGDKSASTPRVAKPTNVQMHMTTESTPASLMSLFTILGKDEYGNYWIRGTLREEYWPKVEHSLLEEVLLERVEPEVGVRI
ncbi:Transcriptional regulator sdnM [Apiospora marii]|uniref:Transcriptional regulator sdnM n=1 Tax=Apiospora marii TaxID=335849 RepID=A0ABR1RAE1_9PEZI